MKFFAMPIILMFGMSTLSWAEQPKNDTSLGFSFISPSGDEYIIGHRDLIKGSVVRAPLLLNYRLPQTGSLNGRSYTFQSAVALHEYDCLAQTTELLTIYRFEGQNGQGVLQSRGLEIPKVKKEVTPDSIGEMLLEAVCSIV